MRNSTTFKIKYQNSVQILTKNERKREFFFKIRRKIAKNDWISGKTVHLSKMS
jgi:hypothetical protein